MKKKNITLILLVTGMIGGGIYYNATANTEEKNEKDIISTEIKSPETETSDDQPNLEGWNQDHKDAVKMMTDKYGKPNESTPNMVVWYNNGPWKKTIIYKEDIEHHFPKKHTDYVQQYINFKTPVSKYTDVTTYDGSVMLERTKGEMSARCDNEPMNFLALNLANEIVTGKRTVKDAREFYAKTAMESMAGKKSDYTEKLLFNTSNKNTGDPDEPMMMKGMEKMMGASGQ